MADTPENKDETAMTETPEYSVFLTDGTMPLARVLTRLLIEGGHKVTAMTDTADGAAMIREDGGLPVFADPNRAGEIVGMLKLAKADVIVHIAPQNANLSPYARTSYSAEQVLESTKAIVEAAQTAEIGYFVYPSFAMLYGNTGGTFADETKSLGKVDDPLAKVGRQAEILVMESGLNYTILRAGYVYGPTSPVMRAISDALSAGRPVHTGKGDNVAPWVTTVDMATALYLAIYEQPHNEIFNIVDDLPATPREFLDQLAIEQGIATQGGMAALLKRFNRPQAPELLGLSTRVSNIKAKDALGWTPKFADYKAGIDDLLLSWRMELGKELNAEA